MKVSVVMITYNHENFIEQAINSALFQITNFDYEIVIGEDCSTDKTRDIVLEFYKRHPDKIRLLLHDRNVGMNNNFLQTITRSRGKYIAPLEGDDYWTSPFKLQKQVDLLDNKPELSMCFHNANVYYDDESRVSYRYNPFDQNDISSTDDLWERCIIAFCSAMFRKDPITNLPDWFNTINCPDWALYILYAEKGKIGYIKETMSAQRIHEGGVWSGLNEIQQFEVVIKFYRSMNVNLNFRYNKTIKMMTSKYLYDLALIHKKNGDIDQAKACLLKCFTESPFNKSIPFRNLVKVWSLLYLRQI